MPTHHFTPTTYYTSIGTPPAALRVADGDTVITTTVDAFGLDANLNAAAPRGNPMTGPFYVEGAAPGDTLAVTLERIEPNRETGYTAHGLAANVLDPEYVRVMPWESGLAEWRVDLQRRVARLARETALGDLELPIAPMIGCFGVAASRDQAISTYTCAEHGGNMDYRGFREGVTAYFPVFAPGALFYIGDVHALQGDGEIAGTGIEISAEVQFTLRVLKGKAANWPRGENENYIFTVGNARPLDQALQHATTEMVRWLEQDYGLDPMSASYLMGLVVEYEVGNVYDPDYTMICKLPKRLLERYRKG